jgi:hypothetical protein
VVIWGVSGFAVNSLLRFNDVERERGRERGGFHSTLINSLAKILSYKLDDGF